MIANSSPLFSNRTVATATVALLLSVPAAAQLRAFDMTSDRQCTGRLFFENGSSPGSFFINWDAPVWKDDYVRVVEGKKATGPQRLGRNAWTTLDNSVTLKLGSVRVEPGHWCLSIERIEGGAIHLLFYSGAEVLKHKLIPIPPYKVEPKHRVPLQLTRHDEVAKKLKFATTLAEDDVTTGTFELHFGPFVGSTSWKAMLGGGEDRQAKLDAAIADMIALVKAGELKKMILTYAHPDDVAKIDLEAMNEVPQALLDQVHSELSGVRDAGLKVKPGQNEIEFTDKRGEKGSFVWLDGAWKLKEG